MPLETLDQAQMVTEAAAEALPLLADAALLVVTLMGLFLWLFGRGSVRGVLVMLGMAVGVVACMFLINRAWPQLSLLPWVIIGGVIGGFAAWIMSRLWIALLLALTLGVVSPWVLVIWHGQPMPDGSAQVADAALTLVGVQYTPPEEVEGGEESSSLQLPALPLATSQLVRIEADEGGETPPEPELMDRAADAVAPVIEAWGEWWQGLSETLRSALLATAAVGVLLGLIGGLILPDLGASLVAALIGVLLMSAGLGRLIEGHAPSVAAIWPDSPRVQVVLFLAVAGLGALFQWMISGRRADK